MGRKLNKERALRYLSKHYRTRYAVAISDSDLISRYDLHDEEALFQKYFGMWARAMRIRFGSDFQIELSYEPHRYSGSLIFIAEAIPGPKSKIKKA